MAKAAILFALGALLAVLSNVVAGALVGFGWIAVTAHTRLALPTTIFALFGWMVVIFYFIGAFAWVQSEVEQEGVPERFVDDSRTIRRAVLPSVVWAILGLIAAYVLGGGADTGAVPPGVHLGLALLALFLHVVAVYRTIVFVGMALDLQARVEAAELGTETSAH